MVIPSSVKTLHEHSFDNCFSLTKLIISDGQDILDFYSSSGNVPVYFVNCPLQYLYLGETLIIGHGIQLLMTCQMQQKLRLAHL